MKANAISLRANDGDRRAKLRTFLMECRRNLPELTCEEIARLTHVSAGWYRTFESGRLRRVSVPFLARLSRVLQLRPVQSMALYFLALPEIYEAYAAQRASASGVAA